MQGGIWERVGYNNQGANSTYYLYTNKKYWLLSSFTFYNKVASVFAVSSNGAIMGIREDEYPGVRPSISLKSNTAITTGDGTANNPYIVE